MRDGFVKVAAATLNTKVADVEHNKWEIFRLIDETIENGDTIRWLAGYVADKAYLNAIYMPCDAKA